MPAQASSSSARAPFNTHGVLLPYRSLAGSFLLRPSLWEDSQVIRCGTVEAHLKNVLELFATAPRNLSLTEGKTSHIALDVGANIGVLTLCLNELLKARGRKFKVLSFEPNPYVFRRLQTTMALNGCPENIVLRNVALADKASPQANLHCVDPIEIYQGNHSLLLNEKIAGSLSGHIRSVSVAVSTVDAEVERLKSSISAEEGCSPRVSFIKIDVEGAELAVLRGARKTLQEDRPFVILELQPSRLLHLGIEPVDFQWLYESGYYCYGINSTGELGLVSQEFLGDLIARGDDVFRDALLSPVLLDRPSLD